MGYRNEIYRAYSAQTPVYKAAAAVKDKIAPGSFCIPVTLMDWKQKGWHVLSGIELPEAAATRADPKDSIIHGLSYSLQLCTEGGCEKIMLRLDSWSYDKQGETTDLPIMELIFDATKFSSPPKALETIKVMARPINLTERVASRAVNAALFFINQIKAGQVPDFERILELHRVHPDLNRDPGTMINTNHEAWFKKPMKGVNDSGTRGV